MKKERPGGTALIPRWNWWSQAGSNRRPLECHSSALPTELWPLTEISAALPSPRATQGRPSIPIQGPRSTISRFLVLDVVPHFNHVVLVLAKLGGIFGQVLFVLAEFRIVGVVGVVGVVAIVAIVVSLQISDRLVD